VCEETGVQKSGGRLPVYMFKKRMKGAEIILALGAKARINPGQDTTFYRVI